jgi:hypothetical protein
MQAINLVLERETKREKNLEARIKEAKLAAKKAEVPQCITSSPCGTHSHAPLVPETYKP